MSKNELVRRALGCVIPMSFTLKYWRKPVSWIVSWKVSTSNSTQDVLVCFFHTNSCVYISLYRHCSDISFSC